MFGILTCFWWCCFGEKEIEKPIVEDVHAVDVRVTEDRGSKPGSFTSIDLDGKGNQEYHEFESEQRRSTDEGEK